MILPAFQPEPPAGLGQREAEKRDESSMRSWSEAGRGVGRGPLGQWVWQWTNGQGCGRRDCPQPPHWGMEGVEAEDHSGHRRWVQCRAVYSRYISCKIYTSELYHAIYMYIIIFSRKC